MTSSKKPSGRARVVPAQSLLITKQLQLMIMYRYNIPLSTVPAEEGRVEAEGEPTAIVNFTLISNMDLLII